MAQRIFIELRERCFARYIFPRQKVINPLCEGYNLALRKLYFHPALNATQSLITARKRLASSLFIHLQQIPTQKLCKYTNRRKSP